MVVVTAVWQVGIAGSWCTMLGWCGVGSAGGGVVHTMLAWHGVGQWAGLRGNVWRVGGGGVLVCCVGSAWHMTSRWWQDVVYLVGACGGGLAVEVLRAVLGWHSGFGDGQVLQAMSGRHVGAGMSGGDERAQGETMACNIQTTSSILRSHGVASHAGWCVEAGTSGGGSCACGNSLRRSGLKPSILSHVLHLVQPSGWSVCNNGVMVK
ncbi:hypothetical protein EDB83DRAFT_2319708 [Lactarius deliciosus]|nr:hypothetical protein EDB83DRAFT_2319708 [Lactarius deliciosus]